MAESGAGHHGRLLRREQGETRTWVRSQWYGTGTLSSADMPGSGSVLPSIWVSGEQF